MTTIEQLRSWRPARLGQVADDLLAHRRALVALQDEMDAGEPPTSWIGSDRAAADEKHQTLLDTLIDEVTSITVAVDALETAQTEVQGAQDDLEAAIGAARSKGLRVDTATGRVEAPPEGEGDTFLDRWMAEAAVSLAVGEIEAALQRAADADTALSQGLALAASGVDAEGSTLADGTVLVTLPPPRTGPPGSVETYAIALEGGLGVMGGTYMLLRVEHLADGTVKVTKILSDGVGYGAGGGFDLSLMHEDRRYGTTTIASADAMLMAGDGEVYVMDEGEFDSFLPALLVDAGAEKVGDLMNMMMPGGGVSGLGDYVPDIVGGIAGLVGGDDYKLPDPVATVEQVGVKGSADAAWGLLAGGASGNVGINGTGSLITHDDGTRSLVYDVKADGAVRAYAGYDGDSLANASAEGKAGYKITVDVGKDGTPETARLDVTYGGQHVGERGESPDAPGDADDNYYREQSFSVELDDDDTREALTRLTREGDVDGFLEATRDDVTVTRRDYDMDTGTSGVTLEGGGIIFKGGGSVEYATETGTTRSAEYWDGQRWRTWE